MNRLITVLMLSSIAILNAQVGINTTNPTKTLDINGELRVRNIPLEGTQPSTTLVIDDNGNLLKSGRLSLYEIFTIEAPNSEKFTIPSGNTQVNDLELGLEQTIIIPANREAVVRVTYSVPMGTNVDDEVLSSYMGIRFMRNNVEAPAGSRKFTIPLTGYASGLTTSNVSKMGSLTALYVENVAASNSVNTITYKLNGYVEHLETTPVTYIFNRYSQTGTNYNWGNANMAIEVYIR